MISCYGCGALVRDLPGKAHAYIGAAAGCWEAYGQILAKEYGEYGYPELTHALSVDTYAVQHPGQPARQSIQSVYVHLARLYLLLEKGTSVRATAAATRQILLLKNRFVWLEPPAPNGHITVNEVVKAEDLTQHMKLVEDWARDVWRAWHIHRDHILTLIQNIT